MATLVIAAASSIATVALVGRRSDAMICWFTIAWLLIIAATRAVRAFA